MLVLRSVLSPDIHDFLVMELIIIVIFIDLNTLTTQKTRDIEPMLSHCWADVVGYRLSSYICMR